MVLIEESMSQSESSVEKEIKIIEAKYAQLVETILRRDILQVAMGQYDDDYGYDVALSHKCDRGLRELRTCVSSMKTELEELVESVKTKVEADSDEARYIQTLEQHMLVVVHQVEQSVPQRAYDKVVKDSKKTLDDAMYNPSELREKYDRLYNAAMNNSNGIIPNAMARVLRGGIVADKIKAAVEIKTGMQILAATNPEAYEDFCRLEEELDKSKLDATLSLKVLEAMEKIPGLEPLCQHLVESVITCGAKHTENEQDQAKLAAKIAKHPSRSFLQSEKNGLLKQQLGESGYDKIKLLQRAGLKIEALETDGTARVMTDFERQAIKRFAAEIKDDLRGLKIEELERNPDSVRRVIANPSKPQTKGFLQKIRTIALKVKKFFLRDSNRTIKVKSIVRTSKAHNKAYARNTFPTQGVSHATVARKPRKPGG